MKPVFATILLPFLGSFLILIAPKKYKPNFAVFILGLTFLYGLSIIPVVMKFQEISGGWHLNEWFSLSFLADGLSVFMAVVSSFVALLISLYSLEYMKNYEGRGTFYFWMVLFVGAMMGLIFSANLILIYCFWEITAVCSWRLIGFYRKDKDVKAADKAFLITAFGASLMLLGIVSIYFNYGTLEILSLKDKVIPNLAAFLLLAGIIAKSAQLPLQSWLPDAGVAPTPVTALLHAAVLVKIGIYVFARLFALTFLYSPLVLQTVMILSSVTIIVAAASALVDNNLKRILAYSTISQLGYIILAFSLGDSLAFKIALIYILAHSLAKAGLFLCAGIVEHKTGTKDINELGGLLRGMPYTALAYLLCAFSIIGIPPFLGFWPKFMTVLLALNRGYIAVGLVMIIGAIFTLFYLMRLFNRVFLGEEKIKVTEDKDSIMVWVVLTLGILSLMLGLGVKFPINLISALIR
jgi:NADH:ubiquinone oxidoreductase subunit 5 (subunit L)/multisubunit Na+/H+ antiporter MnhA subunit